MVSDLELLREYSANGSESASSELVNRHVRLVYAVALRQVRDPSLAEDVTQAVFIILFRKAKMFKRGGNLGGWLYRATCFAASDAMKKERRRIMREERALQMPHVSGDAAAFEHAAALLDEGISALREKEREAVILRFFNNKSLSEVGEALGLSEDAARMRVSRALVQLRKFLTVRRVALPVGTIVGAMATQASQAAPAGLAGAVNTAAYVKAGAAALPALAIAQSTLKALAWVKVKTAAYICGGVLAAGGLALVATEKWGPGDLFGSGPSYQVSGTMNVLFPLSSTASEPANSTGSFSIQMKHGVWTFTLEPPPGMGRTPVKYQSDGTQLGYDIQQTSGSGNAIRVRTQHVIEGSPALQPLSPGAVLFASCLHLFFLDYTNAWGWSGSLPSAPVSRVIHPLSWSSAVPPPGPNVGDVWYFDSGIPSVGRDAFVATAPLPAPFQGLDLLSGHVTFGAFTNVGDVSMPVNFRYDRYFPRPGATTTNDVTQVLSLSGTVSKIVSSGKTTVLKTKSEVKQ